MGSTNLYIQMGIADGVADLLKSTASSEHGKGAGKGYHACGRKACGNTHQVGFCDTAVKKSVRKCFLESACFGSISQVSVKNNQVFVLFTKFN